jgi:hypothetical protein
MKAFSISAVNNYAIACLFSCELQNAVKVLEVRFGYMKTCWFLNIFILRSRTLLEKILFLTWLTKLFLIWQPFMSSPATRKPVSENAKSLNVRRGLFISLIFILGNLIRVHYRCSRSIQRSQNWSRFHSLQIVHSTCYMKF